MRKEESNRISNDLQKIPYQKSMQWHITEDAVGMRDTLYKTPNRYFDIEMIIDFDKDKCCPVVVLGEILHYEGLSFTKSCFPPLIQDYSVWVPSLVYVLDPKRSNQKFVECQEVKSNRYRCSISDNFQFDVPKFLLIKIGFFCNEENPLKSLENLNGEVITKKVSNFSDCNLIEKGITPLSCDSYYQFTSFPNIFGHLSQRDAAQASRVFYAALKNLKCYQHLMYFFCGLLFPQCPAPNNGSAMIGGTYRVEYLLSMCPEMCMDLFKGCGAQMDPLFQQAKIPLTGGKEPSNIFHVFASDHVMKRSHENFGVNGTTPLIPEQWLSK